MQGLKEIARGFEGFLRGKPSEIEIARARRILGGNIPAWNITPEDRKVFEAKQLRREMAGYQVDFDANGCPVLPPAIESSPVEVSQKIISEQVTVMERAGLACRWTPQSIDSRGRLVFSQSMLSPEGLAS